MFVLHNESMKDGHDQQLKADANKFVIARHELAETNAQLDRGQKQLGAMHEQATQELSAAKKQHSFDTIKIDELTRHSLASKV